VDRDREHLPDELRRIGDLLRKNRPELSALELDDLKQRAVRRASRTRGSGTTKGSFVRARLLTLLLTLGLVVSVSGPSSTAA
jgi:hypothetical protein